MDATAITVADRKAHIAERRAAGIKDGTIYTELGRLRIVARLVRQAGPHPQGGLHRTPIRSRSRPKASTSRALIRRALDGSRFPHMRQAMTLHDCGPQRCAMRPHLGRCDFERERIDLRDPTITRPHKDRAIVPMLRTAKAALQEAKRGAPTEYVIEWGGERVRSLGRGLRSAAKAARIDKRVSPHIGATAQRCSSRAHGRKMMCRWKRFSNSSGTATSTRHEKSARGSRRAYL